jgi:hypothetical protein
MWSALYWLSHNGDTESIKYLASLKDTLQIKVDFCRPDFQGYFAVDLAARSNYIITAKMILKEMTFQLQEYIKEKSKNAMLNNKYMQSPILFSTILFWACNLGQTDLISSIMDMQATWIYYEAPNFLYKQKNVIHILASRSLFFTR